MGPAALREELDEFVAVLTENSFHLENGLPSVEDWKLQRVYYAQSEPDEPESKVTHTLDVSVYVRDPHSTSDTDLKALLAKLASILPSVDFSLSTHAKLNQSKDVCPEGDLHKHPGAMSYDKLLGDDQEDVQPEPAEHRTFGGEISTEELNVENKHDDL